jgi:DUF3014 family protein
MICLQQLNIKGDRAMGRYDLTEEKSYTGVVIGLILLVLVAGGGWFFWQKSHMEPDEVQSLSLPVLPSGSDVSQTADGSLSNDINQTDAVVLDETVLPEQTVALPELSSSDEAFREAVIAISPELAPWLKPNQLIKKYVLIVNDFSQGLWLEKHMRFLKQKQAFVVENTGSSLVMSKKGYQRYDALAAAIDAVNVNAALATYLKFKPLILQVFADFGYPAERPLDDIFLKTAAQILAAPVIEQPIPLVRPSVFYKYADKKLEALSPVSQQMLRMGPENTRIIQNKVRQLVEVLVNMKE